MQSRARGSACWRLAELMEEGIAECRDYLWVQRGGVRGGFCFYFLFPAFPALSLSSCRGKVSPSLGWLQRSRMWPQVHYLSSVYRHRAWVQGEPLGRAGAGQHVLQSPMEEGAAGWKGFEWGPEEGRRCRLSAPRGGRAGNLFPRPQIETGEERMATEHILSICGKERWPQVSKVCLGPTLRSSDERC